MSEISTLPATFQCTFSNVITKSVASSSPPASRVLALPAPPEPRRRSYEPFQRVGELLDAGAAGEPLPPRGREGRLVELAGPPALVQRAERGADRLLVLGACDEAGAAFPDQRGGGAVLGHDREDRTLGREILEDLAGEDAASAALGVGDQQQQRVRLALQAERLAPRHVVDQLDAFVEPELVHVVAVARAEVADEAHRHVVETGCGERAQKRPRVAPPEERAG